MWQQGTPDQSWDDQLFAAGGHFSQSSHWAALQQALGRQVFCGRGDGWQCLAFIEHGQLGSRLYAPYGPHITSGAGFGEAIKALRDLARQQGAAYVRIDPTGHITPADLRARHLHKSPREAQPQYTWIKDLLSDEQTLLGDMAGSNRNLYNTAAKKGLSFRASRDPADVAAFLPLIRQVAERTGIRPYSDAHFTTMARVLIPRNAALIYIAEAQGQPVAASITFESPTTRYYAHAASATDARKLRPGTPLVVQMILDAKANGQTEFDFFGVAPPSQPGHKWASITQFKQSFGGRLKIYAGTWELPIKPLHYQAYRLAHAIKGKRA